MSRFQKRPPVWSGPRYAIALDDSPNSEPVKKYRVFSIGYVEHYDVVTFDEAKKIAKRLANEYGGASIKRKGYFFDNDPFINYRKNLIFTYNGRNGIFPKGTVLNEYELLEVIAEYITTDEIIEVLQGTYKEWSPKGPQDYYRREAARIIRNKFIDGQEKQISTTTLTPECFDIVVTVGNPPVVEVVGWGSKPHDDEHIVSDNRKPVRNAPKVKKRPAKRTVRR